MSEHDNYCPAQPDSDPSFCVCQFIASARADEREQAAQRVAAADFHPCYECDNARLAIAAARGEDTK